MKISKTIEKFEEIKERIRKAIISKGVDVRKGASLSEMAQKISEIKIDNSKRKEKNNA